MDTSIGGCSSEKDDLECQLQYENEESVFFQNEMYAGTFLKEMNILFENDLLKDITLRVQGQLMSCHKIVLAAASPYFKAMFTLDLNESKQSLIELHEIDFDSVSHIIEYTYTGMIKIHQENVQNLLSAASLFQILPIQRACAKFLETQIDNANCIGIFNFAHIHNCNSLQQKAREYIEKHFTQVCRGEEFFNLSVDKVKDLICSDELNVEQEEVIFEAIMAWISQDEKGRRSLISELLPHIRIGLLSVKYLKDCVMNNKYIQDSESCVNLLEGLIRLESNPQLYCGKHNFSLALRSGMIKPEHCILFVGGIENRRRTTCINCYNPLTRETFYMEDYPTAKRLGDYEVEDLACVVTDHDMLYAGGGNYIYHDFPSDHFDSDDSFDELEERIVRKDFYCYDNDHNKWLSLSPMLFPKSNFTLACLGKKIYCFGGVTENQHPTEIIEVYDIEKNRWSYQGMLPTTLVDLCSVVFEEYIFLLGGRTGVGAHNLVVMYHPVKGNWISKAGMPTPRFKFGACLVMGEIYVAGGQIYSHSSQTISREALKSVEIFNISDNQWRQGPDLPEEMYNVGLHMISGALYCCGTVEYRRLTRICRYNIVCKLDFASNRWNVIERMLGTCQNYQCISARLHTRKLSQVFRPDVDT